jgi:hypothetical protein
LFSHGVEVGRFVDGLKAAGVEFFAGVPDSPLKSFCMYVTDTCVVKKVTPPLLLHQWGQTL